MDGHPIPGVQNPETLAIIGDGDRTLAGPPSGGNHVSHRMFNGFQLQYKSMYISLCKIQITQNSPLESVWIPENMVFQGRDSHPNIA